MDLQVLHNRFILVYPIYLNFLFTPQHCIKAVLAFSPNLMWAIVFQAPRSQPRSLLSTPSSFGWALKLDLQEQAPTHQQTLPIQPQPHFPHSILGYT